MAVKGKTPAKRARKAEENRLRNKVYKTRLKNSIKKYEIALSNNDEEAAKENLIQTISVIDKCVSKGVLHKNTAARKKSALTKALNKASY
ncbi:SSU ribosomal protein S20p [Candidatus Syntrophocurvum alkaliphilum]|uniref:Small ribosomal subunit protein bS20 n=1 Tax=Candidatus Syntrophocurvum alkaliphilum TaxID=2293317 RepID=A0A6I6DJZ2_9FIRM|nr:30S ribosomal protein S20 [Candidatus Syntrophocurvum alkaliphilum]QGU00005.1 SSU ribosomal protein S20p [Candidatus Syntrophocurvum alkaliphilum]